MAEDTIIIDNVEFSADKKILLDFFAETTEYTIPDGVTTIGEYEFESNEELKKIVIPESVTVIKEGAFYGCDLETVVLSEGLLEIQNSAFGACDCLKSVVRIVCKVLAKERFPFVHHLKQLLSQKISQKLEMERSIIVPV